MEISVEELNKLLEKATKDALKRYNKQIYGYGWNNNGETFYIPPYIPEACRNCSNHPSNGGSGICQLYQDNQ